MSIKNLKNRIIGIALAVSFLFSGSVLAVNEVDPSNLASATSISMDSSVHVDLTYPRNERWYKFTPGYTGGYLIYSENNIDDLFYEGFETSVYLYDAEGNYLESGDGSDDDGNFYLNYWLEQGKTYYIRATKHWPSGTDSGSYNMTVTRNRDFIPCITYDGVFHYDMDNCRYPDPGDVMQVNIPTSVGNCTFQWYRYSYFARDYEAIPGATGSSYAYDFGDDFKVVSDYGTGSNETFFYMHNGYSNDMPGIVNVLTDPGEETTVVVPEVRGDFGNLRYGACAGYYERNEILYNHNDEHPLNYVPLFDTQEVPIPAFNSTSVDTVFAQPEYINNGYIYDYSYSAINSMWTDYRILCAPLLCFVKTDDNSGVIVLDQPIEVELGFVSPYGSDYSGIPYEYCNSECMIYSFTPEYAGTYTISSSDIDIGDPYVALFDSDRTCIAYADRRTNTYAFDCDAPLPGEQGTNFRLEQHLDGGCTYYFVVWSYNWASRHDLATGAANTVSGHFTVELTCDEIDTFSVNVTSGGHGNASVSVNTGNTGTEVTLSATPDSGYRLASWDVISGGVTVSNNSFTIGNSDVEIRANFEAIPTQAPSTPAPTASIPTPTIPPANNAPVTETGVAGFVERLYTIALGRASDPVGKQDWIDAITLRGETGAGCARGFLYSPEFLNKGVSNEEFVATLYRTFFDREPDQAGFNAWVEVLNNGTSKEEVIEGFINSTEWANLCLFYGIRNGGTGVPNIEIEPNQATIDFATRLYTTCLNRSADQNGLMAWARQLANQRDTGTGAARGFFFSSEFTGQNVSNGEYVTRLYRTFMNREPDQAGYDAWVGQLDSGVSREEVFDGFAQSIEFARICASYGIVR